MESGRKLRAAGEILRLGGVDYRLESVEGRGGSAVVYRAVYEDELNRGCFHRVLVKELFPYDPRGMIYRGEAGGNLLPPRGRGADGGLPPPVSSGESGESGTFGPAAGGDFREFKFV